MVSGLYRFYDNRQTVAFHHSFISPFFHTEHVPSSLRSVTFDTPFDCYPHALCTLIDDRPPSYADMQAR